jgi:hypothetical protein
MVFTDSKSTHMDYFEIMHANLDNLKIGLEVVQ